MNKSVLFPKIIRTLCLMMFVVTKALNAWKPETLLKNLIALP